MHSGHVTGGGEAALEVCDMDIGSGAETVGVGGAEPDQASDVLQQAARDVATRTGVTYSAEDSGSFLVTNRVHSTLVSAQQSLLQCQF